MSKQVYIAGPMRGYKCYNYPAFDVMRNFVNGMTGCAAYSPADADREQGFDPLELPQDHDWHSWPAGLDRRATIAGCLRELMKCEEMVLLPGWIQSQGACAECAVARWLGLRIWVSPQDISQSWYELAGCIDPAATADPEDILTEALRITQGDRQNAYGPPDQDFTRTAAMWSTLKGVEFSAREVAMFMIALKLSRETHQRNRDNWTDIAGYARCGSLCR